MPFATQAAMLGGNLGVGMEDSLFIARVSQFLLIMFRLPPRLRERLGFLAGWPAQGMGREIWRR
jgi:hypothetical protein